MRVRGYEGTRVRGYEGYEGTRVRGYEGTLDRLDRLGFEGMTVQATRLRGVQGTGLRGVRGCEG